MKQWHTYPPKWYAKPRKKLIKVLDPDKLDSPIFSDDHGSGPLIVYFRKKIFSLAGVMRRNQYMWDLSKKEAVDRFMDRYDGATPSDGLSIEQIYLQTVNYNELEHIRTFVLRDSATDDDRRFVANLTVDNRDRRTEDCEDRQPDIWVHPYLTYDYTYPLDFTKEMNIDRKEQGPYFLSGRDPINNFGLVHDDVERNITWVCCGLDRDTPGCWYGTIGGQYVSYNFAPGMRENKDQLVDAIVRRNLNGLQAMWVQERPTPTMWKDKTFYLSLDAKITGKKEELNDLVLEYMFNQFNVGMSKQLLDGLRQILTWEFIYNEVFCLKDAPKQLPSSDKDWREFIDEQLFLKSDVLIELAKGVFIGENKRLSNVRTLRSAANMEDLITELEEMDLPGKLGEMIAMSKEMVPAYESVDNWNLGEWNFFKDTDLSRFSKTAVKESFETITERKRVAGRLHALGEDMYAMSVNEFREDRTPDNVFYEDYRVELLNVETDIDAAQTPTLSVEEVRSDIELAKEVAEQLDSAKKRKTFKRVRLEYIDDNDVGPLIAQYDVLNLRYSEAVELLNQEQPFPLERIDEQRGDLEFAVSAALELLAGFEGKLLTYDKSAVTTDAYNKLTPPGDYDIIEEIIDARATLRDAFDDLSQFGLNFEAVLRQQMTNYANARDEQLQQMEILAAEERERERERQQQEAEALRLQRAEEQRLLEARQRKEAEEAAKRKEEEERLREAERLRLEEEQQAKLLAARKRRENLEQTVGKGRVRFTGKDQKMEEDIEFAMGDLLQNNLIETLPGHTPGYVLAPSLLNDQNRLRAAAYYVVTKDRRAAAAAQFEYVKVEKGKEEEGAPQGFQQQLKQAVQKYDPTKFGAIKPVKEGTRNTVDRFRVDFPKTDVEALDQQVWAVYQAEGSKKGWERLKKKIPRLPSAFKVDISDKAWEANVNTTDQQRLQAFFYALVLYVQQEIPRKVTNKMRKALAFAQIEN